MDARAGALVLCTVTNAYLLGVMLVFAMVVYPMLGAVERGPFPALYAAFTSRVGVPMVLFEFAALLLTLPLYAWRPERVSAPWVHALVGLGVLYFVLTFGWHLPVHKSLAGGQNGPEVLAPLLRSHWARTALQLVRVGLLARLCVAAMGASPR